MKLSIVYVHSEFWGARAIRDLLDQERACLTHAEELGCKVVKVFREQPSRRSRRKQLSEMFLYLEKNAVRIDYLIIQYPPVLSPYQMFLTPLLKRIRSFGVKIASVGYKNKSR
jgi:hypothetical protein